MKGNKGQALVEFVIILPIMLILIFGMIDLGRIISLKNDLENVTSDVITFYENSYSEKEIEKIINENRKDDVSISINIKEEYVQIEASSTIKPITPGLSYVLKDAFDVKSSRVIKNE